MVGILLHGCLNNNVCHSLFPRCFECLFLLLALHSRRMLPSAFDWSFYFVFRGWVPRSVVCWGVFDVKALTGPCSAFISVVIKAQQKQLTGDRAGFGLSPRGYTDHVPGSARQQDPGQVTSVVRSKENGKSAKLCDLSAHPCWCTPSIKGPSPETLGDIPHSKHSGLLSKLDVEICPCPPHSVSNCFYCFIFSFI